MIRRARAGAGDRAVLGDLLRFNQGRGGLPERSEIASSRRGRPGVGPFVA